MSEMEMMIVVMIFLLAVLLGIFFFRRRYFRLYQFFEDGISGCTRRCSGFRSRYWKEKRFCPGATLKRQKP